MEIKEFNISIPFTPKGKATSKAKYWLFKAMTPIKQLLCSFRLQVQIPVEGNPFDCLYVLQKQLEDWSLTELQINYIMATNSIEIEKIY